MSGCQNLKSSEHSIAVPFLNDIKGFSLIVCDGGRDEDMLADNL